VMPTSLGAGTDWKRDDLNHSRRNSQRPHFAIFGLAPFNG